MNIFDTEIALLFFKIGKYFELSYESWHDARTCAYLTVTLRKQ